MASNKSNAGRRVPAPAAPGADAGYAPNRPAVSAIGGLLVGRILYAALYALAAFILFMLTSGSLGLVYLGLRHPPPYLDWAALGFSGLLAGAALALGIVLWMALALAAVVWTYRCAARGVRILLGRDY